ncbi:MAG: Flp family type IVb pilin [Gemmatimonadetes bacterium]|nr:Flp family type IVb pilin [Gemmatimonadota bacterium]
MPHFLVNLVKDDAGQDLAEYALLIALIALVVIGAVAALGGQVEAVFNDITGKLVTP